jgi:hypothetical protein
MLDEIKQVINNPFVEKKKYQKFTKFWSAYAN